MKGGIVNEDFTPTQNVVVDVEKITVMLENITIENEDNLDSYGPQRRLENDTIRNLSSEDNEFYIHEKYGYEYEKKVAW